MRKFILATAIGAMLLFSNKASANIIDLRGAGNDANFNDITGGSALDVTIQGWLEGEILSFNNHNVTQLPPETTGVIKGDNLNGVAPSLSLEAGDYVVIHYGVGANGVKGSGGGLVALFADANQTFTPASTGSGQNGFGGISFVEIWDHTGSGINPHARVPDGGTTLLLLGLVLAPLGAFGFFRKSATSL